MTYEQIDVESPLLLATFFVRDSLCALDTSLVQEIIRVGAMTPVPHAPEAVRGVMNLRGRIVTLLDAGVILGLGRSEFTKESRVLILEDRGEFVGLIVDGVGEMVEVDSESREGLPANMPPSQARCFEYLCRSGGKVVGVLNAAFVLDESN